MLPQIALSPWVGAPLTTNLNLEVVVIISSRITEPLEGVGLRVLYLAEKVSCQLVGKGMP